MRGPRERSESGVYHKYYEASIVRIYFMTMMIISGLSRLYSI